MKFWNKTYNELTVVDRTGYHPSSGWGYGCLARGKTNGKNQIRAGQEYDSP